MPSLDQDVEIVDVAPPSYQPMVTFLNKEHFSSHIGKVIILYKESVKGFACFSLEGTRRGQKVIVDVDHVTMVLEDGHIHDVVPITIAQYKLVLEAFHIHFIDRSNYRKCKQAIQRYAQAIILHHLNAKVVDNYVGILLLSSSKGHLILLQIGVFT